MRGYSCIGLVEPKTPANIGATLRAAGCYGANMVAISGTRYKRNCTDTLKAWRHLPMIECDSIKDILPYDCIPVAVDLLPGARPLPSYVHPERAMYIFGGEDRTLPDEIVNWCRDKIMIPTKICMNLAACVNVVLYDRLAKMYIRDRFIWNHLQKEKTDAEIYEMAVGTHGQG